MPKSNAMATLSATAPSAAYAGAPNAISRMGAGSDMSCCCGTDHALLQQALASKAVASAAAARLESASSAAQAAALQNQQRLAQQKALLQQKQLAAHQARIRATAAQQQAAATQGASLTTSALNNDGPTSPGRFLRELEEHLRASGSRSLASQK